MTDQEIIAEVKENHPITTDAKVVGRAGMCGVCERPHLNHDEYVVGGHTTKLITRLCAECSEKMMDE